MLISRNTASATLAGAAIAAWVVLSIGAPASPPAGPPASPPAARSRNIDANPPTLAVELAPQYASAAHASRNLFTYDDPPPAAPRVVRAPLANAQPPQQQAPQPIAPPQQPDAPRPPDVPFRCIGRFGPADAPLVALARDRDIINVHAGDVVDGKFIVRSIGIETVEVGFVGFPREADRRIDIGR